MSELDVLRILRTLNQHDVAYVLVGGMAAVAHGSPLPTEDVDVVPARDQDNLDRLALALRELGARLRTGDPGGVAFPVEAGFIAAQPHMLNLTTVAGDLDLLLTPSGFPTGYDGLVGRAVALDLGDGSLTMVAALEDLIRSKQAAGRDKDVAALPYLRALADEVAAEDG